MVRLAPSEADFEGLRGAPETLAEVSGNEIGKGKQPREDIVLSRLLPRATGLGAGGSLGRWCGTHLRTVPLEVQGDRHLIPTSPLPLLEAAPGGHGLHNLQVARLAPKTRAPHGWRVPCACLRSLWMSAEVRAPGTWVRQQLRQLAQSGFPDPGCSSEASMILCTVRSPCGHPVLHSEDHVFPKERWVCLEQSSCHWHHLEPFLLSASIVGHPS